jgi:hypothetical protein
MFGPAFRLHGKLYNISLNTDNNEKLAKSLEKNLKYF